MAEFSSVVDAVQCAAELQEKIEAASVDAPDDRKMRFRICANLGDVIEKEKFETLGLNKHQFVYRRYHYGKNDLWDRRQISSE